MLATRTEHSLGLWFDWLHLVDVDRGVFETPEGCLHIVALLGVELVYADRLHVFLSDSVFCRGWLFSPGQLSSLGDLRKEVVSLEGIKPGNFLLNLLLALDQFLPLLELLHFSLLFSDTLLLLDEIFDHAGSTEEMALVAGSGLDETVVADGAHLELLYGVLPNAGIVSSVYALQLLPFAVGEDRRGCTVFGMLAHGL